MFGVHGRGAGLPRPAARQCDGRKQVRAAGGHDHAHQRCDGSGRRARHRRRWQIPVRLRRSGHLHDHRRARRIQEAGTEERPRAAARRRHGGSDVVSRGDRRDSHGRSPAGQGAVQYQQLRHHAGAAAHRSSADRRAESVQPGQPGPHDHGDAQQREPSVPSRIRQRLRRWGRDPPRERRPPRRRAARGKLQDGLHASRGRGRGNHGLQEQRGRGERPQPRRRHQPEHEIGHE